MDQFDDLTPATRLVRLLLLLVQQPYRYTRRELEQRFAAGEQTVRRDLNALGRCELEVNYDQQYRYAVLPAPGTPEIERLAIITADERDQLRRALERASTKTRDAEILLRKLDSLTDVQRLGLRALRSPELAKIDALEAAIRAQVCVRLIGYRSTNSSEVADRLTEAFYLDFVSGIVHAYDLARIALRHFRLDRFERVEVLDNEPWRHADAHVREATDVFRIVDDRQVRVHLVMDVRAYNDLVERFPAARAEVLPDVEPDRFDFEAQVNHRFRGLLPWLLANHAGVAVVAPDELRRAVRAEAEEILGA